MRQFNILSPKPGTFIFVGKPKTGKSILIVPIAKLKLEFQELKEIANDQLLTEIERINALDKAMKVQEEIAKKEGDLLALRIEKMKIEQGINDTMRTGDKELQQLLADQINFEAAAQKKIAGLSSFRRIS